MKDAFHGSARLSAGLVTAHRGATAIITRPVPRIEPALPAPRHRPHRAHLDSARRRAVLRPRPAHRARGRRRLGRDPLLERAGARVGARHRADGLPRALRHPRAPGDAQQPDQPQSAGRGGRSPRLVRRSPHRTRLPAHQRPAGRASPACRCAPCNGPPRRCGCWAWPPR